MGVEGTQAARRTQYAALPYRVRQDGAVQIRLITSRETRRWVIPKGWPMKGISPAKAAAVEAYEEAGLVGNIAHEPVGTYTYEKRLSVRSVTCDVLVFPLKVKRKLQSWPERSQRVGFWFTIESAAAAVNEEDLKQLILEFGEQMATKWKDKLEADQQKVKAKKAAAPQAKKAATPQKQSSPAPASSDAPEGTKADAGAKKAKASPQKASRPKSGPKGSGQGAPKKSSPKGKNNS